MYSSLIPVHGGPENESHFMYIAVLNHTHTCTQCPPRTIKRLLDKNLAFHKAIAWVIILSSAIHVIAHWYNYERLLAAPTQTQFREQFPEELRRIPDAAQPSPEVATVSCNPNQHLASENQQVTIAQ